MAMNKLMHLYLFISTVHQRIFPSAHFTKLVRTPFRSALVMFCLVLLDQNPRKRDAGSAGWQVVDAPKFPNRPMVSKRSAKQSTVPPPSLLTYLKYNTIFFIHKEYRTSALI